MHSQILTDHEREMLTKFLETGEKAKGFRLLKLRINSYNSRLHQDLNLIDEASKKF
jgi:hypothetical protein